MRLADFILGNTEVILQGWDAFARSIWPGADATPRRLRDHAGEMLIALAEEMKKASALPVTNDDADSEKSAEEPANAASDIHAITRIESGFDLQDLVAEYRALRKNVIELWQQNSAATGPEVLNDIIMFSEVLDRLLAEAILSYVRRVDQSREVFLAILGHDLRNPLQAVMVQASILAQSGSLDDACQSVASQMTTSISAMSSMIGDLLDFTGTQLGAKMALHPASMDLALLCKEVIDELSTVHPTRTLVFECKDSLRGEWDPIRIRQLISNLVGNALQHGCGKSPIRITAEATESGVRLAVRNQGVPIPEESASIIFEPLVRNASQEPNRQAGSIGLGLYIAREVATAHGGSISVQSGPEETVFTVEIPHKS